METLIQKIMILKLKKNLIIYPLIIHFVHIQVKKRSWLMDNPQVCSKKARVKGIS